MSLRSASSGLKLANSVLSTVCVLACLISISCMAPTHELPVYSREIATVGDFIIKEDLIRFRLQLEMDKFPQNHFGSDRQELKKNPEFQELLKSVLDDVILDYSIIVYGQGKGIETSKEDLKQGVEARKKQWNPKSFESFLGEHNISYSRLKQYFEEQVRVKYVMDRELSGKLHVPFHEIQSYYQKHAQDFSVLERVRVRHIVTDSAEKAEEIHERLLKGENFAKLAVNHSLSPDRAQGGDLGYFARGVYPKEFDEVCFDLKKGEISQVVKSDYGHHIFKLLDKKPAGRKSLEEVAPQIQQSLFEEKLKANYDEWIKVVKGKVLVIVHRDVFEDFIL